MSLLSKALLSKFKVFDATVSKQLFASALFILSAAVCFVVVTALSTLYALVPLVLLASLCIIICIVLGVKMLDNPVPELRSLSKDEVGLLRQEEVRVAAIITREFQGRRYKERPTKRLGKNVLYKTVRRVVRKRGWEWFTNMSVATEALKSFTDKRKLMIDRAARRQHNNL